MFNKAKIKLTGRAGILYSESGRAMRIDSEMLACGEYDIVIYERSIKQWEPPRDNVVVAKDDKAKIKHDIDECLKRYRIEWA